MSHLRPFFLLLSRPAVFWIGTVVAASLGFLLLALSQPEEVITPWVDAAFLANLAWPAAAGWIGGSIIRDFQSTSLAWPLPGVNRRLAAGFVVTGIAVSTVVACLSLLSLASSHSPVVALSVAFAGYFVGGILFDASRPWLAGFSLLVILVLIARSRLISELTEAHPMAALGICLLLIAFSLTTLFSGARLRFSVTHPRLPFPGRYSVERSEEIQRKRIARPATGAGIRPGVYIGSSPRSWLRAAVHETYGSFDWRPLLRLLGQSWVLALLYALRAWADKGALSYGESLARTVHQSLFASPHVQPFGDEIGADGALILVVAATGAALGLRSARTLGTTLLYPISRQLRARTVHRRGLIDVAVFFLGFGTFLAVVGWLAGWAAGYEAHPDYLPFYLRPLAATALLMPAAFTSGLWFSALVRRQSGNTLVANIFVVIACVGAVWALTLASPRIFHSPALEAIAIAALLMATQIVYLRWLERYFSTADLA